MFPKSQIVSKRSYFTQGVLDVTGQYLREQGSVLFLCSRLCACSERVRTVRQYTCLFTCGERVSRKRGRCLCFGGVGSGPRGGEMIRRICTCSIYTSSFTQLLWVTRVGAMPERRLWRRSGIAPTVVTPPIKGSITCLSYNGRPCYHPGEIERENRLLI